MVFYFGKHIGDASSFVAAQMSPSFKTGPTECCVGFNSYFAPWQ